MLFNLNDEDTKSLHRALIREQGHLLTQLVLFKKELPAEPLHPRSERQKIYHNKEEERKLREEYKHIGFLLNRLMKETD